MPSIMLPVDALVVTYALVHLSASSMTVRCLSPGEMVLAAGSIPDVCTLRLIHDRTGAVKVVSELVLCHAVCHSGGEGACRNTAVVGLTDMTVKKVTFGVYLPNDTRGIWVLSGRDIGDVILIVKVAAVSSLDRPLKMLGETTYADGGSYLIGVRVGRQPGCTVFAAESVDAMAACGGVKSSDIALRATDELECRAATGFNGVGKIISP